MLRPISLARYAVAAAIAIGLAGPSLAIGVEHPSKAVETYMAAVNSGDAEAVAALYHEDAILMGPDGSTAEGREAIKAANARNFAAGKVQLAIDKPLTDFGDHNGVMVYTWTMTIAPDGAAPVSVKGRSLLGWGKEDGQWVILADMYQVLN